MFQNYELNNLFDEMFLEKGVPREYYQPVYGQLTNLNDDAIQRRRQMADIAFRDQGITFTVYKDSSGTERIFPFDLVPRIVPSTRNGGPLNAGSSKESPPSICFVTTFIMSSASCARKSFPLT